MNPTPGRSRILLIDIGNTNLKWCWLEAGHLSDIRTLSHKQRGVGALFKQHWQNEKPPGSVLIANVAGGAVGARLHDWIEKNWGAGVDFVESRVQALGVTNGYLIPEQLGVDRWLTLIAAHQSDRGACCIVDCGTAITVDVIDENGLHLGGLILPGTEMMRQALLEKTTIPPVDAVEARTLLGRDSATAISSAAINSAAALIERVIGENAQVLGKQPLLLLTGSGAKQVMTALNVSYEYESDLVMLGLRALALARISHQMDEPSLDL